MMRLNRLTEALVLQETVLRPGGEWTLVAPGCSLVYLSQGVGYWLGPAANCELATGSMLVLWERSRGLLRASQLGDAVLHSFSVRPERLSGLVTLAEQRSLEQAALKEDFAARVVSAGDALPQLFKSLCERRHESSVRQRLRMVELFIEVFDAQLRTKPADAAAADEGAQARLEEILRQMHAPEMLQLSFQELAVQVGCCPRHLGRIFQEVVGMSFREKQAQLRLGRAQELLATTKSKVVEVALESGYQSLSLFNLMFKRRFGLTPAQWRQRPERRKVRM
jgi:transcriptional regulator GlxA family with amidase domain